MNKKRVSLVVLIIVLVLIGSCLALYFHYADPSRRRTVPGKVIRFMRGEPMGMQYANDFAEDLDREFGLAKLQDWARSFLANDAANIMQAPDEPPYWAEADAKIPEDLYPDFLPDQWWNQVSLGWPSKGIGAVGLRLNPNGKPECVVFASYLYGVLIGPDNFIPTFQPWYLRKLAPGIFVYAIEK